MEIANIHEAKSQLSKLVEHAMSGEEVIIAKAGQLMVRLVPIHADIPGFTVPLTIADHDDKAAERNSGLTKLTNLS